MISIGKMKIKYFFETASTKAILSTLILVIPLVLSIMTEISIIYQITLITTAAIINLSFVYFAYRRPKLKINDMLNVMALSLWSKEHNHFRVNVMLYNPRKKTLSVKYLSASMMGAVDRKFCIKCNQGCAGEAFRTKGIIVVDLNKRPHKDYHIKPKDVWAEMKSILSIPIFEDEDHTKVKGVLNIDSDLIVTEAKFFDTNVIKVATIYSDWISEMI
ncbi:MAG: hypothetical protein FWD52_08110 [Candidatus Bathyarchaeota archaeon]|nr:hypothetical protein [Candidatus Termiticorpusculum sp.]